MTEITSFDKFYNLVTRNTDYFPEVILQGIKEFCTAKNVQELETFLNIYKREIPHTLHIHLLKLLKQSIN